MPGNFNYPQIDFAGGLNAIGDNIQQGRIRSALSSVPLSGGLPDYTALGQKVIGLDPALGAKLLEAGATQNLAVMNYSKPKYAVAPDGRLINTNATSPDQVVVGGGSGGVTNPAWSPGTPEQLKAQDSFNRAAAANATLESIGNPDTADENNGTIGDISKLSEFLPEGFLKNLAASPQRQQFDNAGDAFVAAINHLGPGERVSPFMLDEAKKIYLPQAGDSPEKLAQKAANRKQALAGLQGMGGPSFNPTSPQMPQVAAAKTFPKPTQAALAALKQHPEKLGDFVSLFGPDAARAAMAQ